MASYFVDPSIGTETGLGTIGDPFGTIQHCLNTIPLDSGAGDKINIKAGVADVLSAPLSLSSYGTPTFSTGLWFDGYESAENDGGQFEIDGNGNQIWNHPTVEGVKFSNGMAGNTGASPVFTMDRFCGLFNMTIHSSTGGGVVFSNTDATSINRCWFHNLGGVGIKDSAHCSDSLFTNSANEMTTCFDPPSGPSSLIRCCFLISGATNGARLYMTRANNNSFFTSGTGRAIIGMNPYRLCGVFNNVFEGFSEAIDITNPAAAVQAGPIYDNSFFDCDTEYDSTKQQQAYGNETLTETPFEQTGTIAKLDDRELWFAPKSIGQIKSKALHRGAVQGSETGGGFNCPLIGGALVLK